MIELHNFKKRKIMKVLLLKDVKSLGKAGDVCEVKDGYGKNFLIGKNLAILATNEAINRYKSQQKKLKEEEERLIAKLKETANKLENITIQIFKKTGNNGALYGAITKDDIAEALKNNHNIIIDKKALDLKNPIKQIGLYEIDLKLGYGIHATCKASVEAQ